MSHNQTRSDRRTPSELFCELAHQGSLLVRSELELSAAERLPELRRALVDAAAVLAAAVAVIVALGSLAWAAVRALDLVIPSWSAPLVAAGAWLLIAGLLLQYQHPRRLARILSRSAESETARSARQTRSDAERAVRESAERFLEAMVRQAAARELKITASAAERALGDAEADVLDLLRELTNALTARGRAGVGVLERVVGRRLD